MTQNVKRNALLRRQRRGSEKREIGIQNIRRMLPSAPAYSNGSDAPPNLFAADLVFLSLEDSYCDMWGRTDVISARTRSVFNVSLMTAVGNVSNEFELYFHAPGAVHNGVTIEELETITVQARAYVGSPASGWAMQSMARALAEQKLMPTELPPANKGRREKAGSEKRAIAKEVLRKMLPESSLLNISDDKVAEDVFAPELDYMMLESCYWDLWARTDTVDLHTRTVITLGLLMGLGNRQVLSEFIPAAIRNGVTVPELEEFVYQASVYLGFVSGAALRATIGAALKKAE